MGNLWLALLAGITTGGLSCFAVQGGLLASALASQGTGDKKFLKEKSILMFLLAKLLAYTLIGFVLGALGSAINITPRLQGWLQIFVGIYMLLTAMRLLDIHPFFRRFVIQPPKAFFKFLKKNSQGESFFTPAFLGFLTVLIPCGVTQAMMILAVGSSNALWGAGIMFSFVLGTFPVFFLIGLATVELLKNKSFSIVAAAVIAIMGMLSINNGQLVRGSVHTLQNYLSVLKGENNPVGKANITNGVQEVTINVVSRGYQASVDVLKVGVPVKLTLITNGAGGCARAFTIPYLNYFKVLPATGTQVVEFTPQRTGLLTYTCSMGMYSGSFNVIE
ncbi:MAG: sulfite exporter TauE/SafE family protein [bacterium]|nr:sulfite exporter TauE/SafE family protein [bacterium]